MDYQMNMNIDAAMLNRSTSPRNDLKPFKQNTSADKIRHNFFCTLDNLKSFTRSFRIFLFDSVLVEGIEKHSGHLVRTLYVGATEPPAPGLGKLYSKTEAVEKFANFMDIMSTIYSNYEIILREKNINGFKIIRRLKKYEKKADMVFIDMELLFVLGLRRSSYLAIPQWVTLKLRIADSWKDVLSSFPKPLTKKIKRILKHEYSYCTGNTKNMFEYFYHKMYVPYTKKRFGDAAVIYDENKLKNILNKSDILFLFRNNRLVLGSLITYHHDSAFSICCVGADYLQPDMFKGASEAIDYFSILCAFEKGCQAYDFMGSRPLLADGAFRYKRKWGTIVDKFYRIEANIFFKPVLMTAGVKAFIARNPFITESPNGLRGRILLDVPASAMDIKNCVRDYETKGLNGMDIFCIAGVQNGAGQALFKHIPQVKVYDISNSSNPELDFCKLGYISH